MAAATPKENPSGEPSADAGADQQLELRLTLLEVRQALEALDGADWKRVRTLAKWRARRLVDISGDDLCHKAVVALMTSRRWPANVHPLKVLSSVMRSIASNARASAAASPVRDDMDVAEIERIQRAVQSELGLSVRVPTPEDELAAKQHLQEIFDAVADDEEMGLLLMMWTDNVRGKDAQSELDWDDKTFDRVRNRLTRKLKSLKY
jgi:hypothetical protein